MSTDADAAVASPLLSGAGGRGHFRGVGKDLPWPLHSGRFLPPLLALGFSDGYEACPAPAPLGASLLSSNRTGPQLPAQTQVAPGRWGGGAIQRPRGPRAAPDASRDPQLGARPPAQHPCPPEATPGSPDLLCPPFFLLFLFFPATALTPKTRNIFSLYKQNSPSQEAISFQV